MNYYTTPGRTGPVPGSVVVKAKSIREARSKLLELSRRDKRQVFDMPDLSRVTRSSMWNAMWELIESIEAGGRVINVRKLAPGVYFEVH